MKSKNVLLGGAALALIGLASPAAADNISTGVWYAGFFTTTGTALFGPGENAGTSPSGVLAPAGTTWTITLSKPTLLYVTDVETSGDQFTMFDNGALLGTTSTPVAFAQEVGECITCAWDSPDFSHGVFLLPAGVNVISGIFDGVVGGGDFDFAVGVTGVPEPATWALMLAGFAGLGAALRGRRKALASPA